MWIEAFIHKEKKGIIDIPALASGRGLSYGTLDRDRILVRDRTGERTVLFDRYFPGMAIDLKQDTDTAELRLNFPAGSYDIELYFDLIEDVCRQSGTETFYIEATDLGIDEKEFLIDYFVRCSEEILKILTSQLKEHSVTGLIVIGAVCPFVIGIRQAEEFDNDIDKYALMINNAQRTKAKYGRHWSYIGGYRNFCVYEAPAGEKTILPLHPVPYLGGSMPRRCEYYVDVPGVAFFKYDDFLREYRPDSERYDGASIIVQPQGQRLTDLRYRCGMDISTAMHTSFRSYGRFIDWGEYHYGKVRRKRLITDEINCYSQIAVYLEWCLRHGLLSDEFLSEYPDFEQAAADPDEDLREYVMNRIANGGALAPLMFNEQGRAFTESYYLFGNKGFPFDVDRTAEEILGHELYNCEEFKNEAYLFVPYDESYRRALSSKIDEAWEKFLSGELDPADFDIPGKRLF